MEIDRVLCPIDFSETSSQAIDVAVAIAGHYNARLTALHVVAPVEPTIDRTLLNECRREAAAFLARARERIPLEVLVEAGQPAPHILAHAERFSSDLIVIGTHGKSGFEQLVLGAVTEKVLRKADCAVMTVPPSARGTARLPFARLLCAVDFSEASRSAMQAALSLSRDSGAPVTLLHVLEWPWDEKGAAVEEFRRHVEQGARERLGSLVPESVPASHVTTKFSSGKPYVQILESATDEHSDVIVIGVRGRQPLDLALFGSTVNQVVRRATCPVLTLR